MRFAHLILAGLGLGLAASPAVASCNEESFENGRYTICRFDPRADDIRLFLRNEEGQAFRSFSALEQDLERQGMALTFAMNAGMYQKDMRPVGLFISDGEELRGANTYDPPPKVKPVPNFYKKPNGVFYIGEDGAGVLTTEAYLEARPNARVATQSGPMLVIDGKLHPAFIDGSRDKKPRNGVGVCGDEVVFAISEQRVNFHTFARLFRDRLGCPNALFLDGGSASGLYAPEIGRNDWPPFEGYGPILGVVRKSEG